MNKMNKQLGENRICGLVKITGGVSVYVSMCVILWGSLQPLRGGGVMQDEDTTQHLNEGLTTSAFTQTLTHWHTWKKNRLKLHWVREKKNASN